ncbi:hypothetical protein L6164_033542 [Bauhinia variegata]|uniref:Uncharacterized protein n=1 Tax=Bauhinia variegata TaxID=167791 RepID=A0ACB9KS16_BAUVA|nr:hypothetical protein L6164_033542 [Bauhinia variegata]
MCREDSGCICGSHDMCGALEGLVNSWGTHEHQRLVLNIGAKRLGVYHPGAHGSLLFSTFITTPMVMATYKPSRILSSQIRNRQLPDGALALTDL